MDNNLRLANEIMEHVGGAENITAINHCSTRLRLKVANPENFDLEGIKNINGVVGAVEALGGYQIIVGNNVSKVYKAIMENYAIKVEGETGRVAANPFDALLNVMSDIVGPAIPAIVAAGLISAVLSIASLLGMSADSTTYTILYAASQAAFYFLPFIIAYTAARHWKINPVLTIFITGIMMYPSVQALTSYEGPVTFFGLPVRAVDYASTLIPTILTCWVMHYVYDFVEDKCPNAIRYVMAPFAVVIIMIPVALCVTGPLGSYIGSLIAAVITWIDSVAPGLTVVVLGAIAPFLVLTGSHLALIPLVIANFSTKGYDNALLIAFIGMNFSQFAVSLAVFLKAKTAALKSTAFSTGLTAFLTGTTEPALYGLCLRLKKPLIATFIGCIANGIYCALTNVKIYSFGAPSFFTMANFIDPNGSNNFMFALGAVAVTIVVTFVATWILGFDESIFSEGEEETKKA